MIKLASGLALYQNDLQAIPCGRTALSFRYDLDLIGSNSTSHLYRELLLVIL